MVDLSPRLSAIMPTADRRRFVPDAIAAFLAQGRDDAELVILDDGDDPVADLVPDDPGIRYVRETVRRALGEKRNRLCALARGDIILHWDDDDWHAPDRIARQIEAIDAHGADICGLDRVIFLSDDGEQAWDYVYRGRQRWVCGGSLAYRRAFWERHPFPALRSGEDTRWVFSAVGAQIHAMDAPDLFVGRVHAGNTSPKRTQGGFYHSRDPAPVRAMVAGFSGRALSPPAAVRPVVNVNACLVHEKPECVVDLVRNLRHLDPASPILLYDGSPSGGLLDPRLPWRRWGAEIVPNPAPMRWGTLHRFALDCIRHLEAHGHDVITIVDSDQLMLRGGYPEHLARHLGEGIRRQLLSGDPAWQGPATRIGPARTAVAEIALWRPWLARFPDGEAKFVHWTFWPATAIGADVGRAILALFDDPDLQAILSVSKLWATEEIMFPTFAALLGFDVVRNPCRTDYVQYRTPWRAADLERALATPDAFFIHPVPRQLDNVLRARVRDRHNGYRAAPPAPLPAAPVASLWPLIEAMREIEGWLGDEEGEALLLAARAALARPGAAGRIVEVGSHCGKATFLLGEAARTAPVDAAVTAIDRFDGLVGSRDRRLERLAPSRIRFDHMVARHGLAEWIDVRTVDAPALGWSGAIDLLVIDGLHDYPAVAADFCAFETSLGPQARVAFHDYADYYPGVCAFVDELVAGGGWEVETAAATLRILRRPGGGARDAAFADAALA
jgi:hypothetical protein